MVFRKKIFLLPILAISLTLGHCGKKNPLPDQAGSHQYFLQYLDILHKHLQHGMVAKENSTDWAQEKKEIQAHVLQEIRELLVYLQEKCSTCVALGQITIPAKEKKLFWHRYNMRVPAILLATQNLELEKIPMMKKLTQALVQPFLQNKSNQIENSLRQ